MRLLNHSETKGLVMNWSLEWKNVADIKVVNDCKMTAALLSLAIFRITSFPPEKKVLLYCRLCVCVCLSLQYIQLKFVIVEKCSFCEVAAIYGT